jgi:vesicle transport protein SEC22
MSYESGPYYLHYLIEAGVCYLTLCERGYPKKLAYQYLEDLQREFHHQNQDQVGTVARPYAFIKFGTPHARTRATYALLVMRAIQVWVTQWWRHGSNLDGRRKGAVSNSPDGHGERSDSDTFIQKTKRLYLDTRTQRNLNKMNEELAEVQQIMTRNIQEVLGQGERLDRTPPPSRREH